MTVRELAPGLWRWTAPHPDWKPGDEWEREIGCVYYEAPEAVCLIDPLVSQAEGDALWTELDRDIERASKPVAVLLTVHWHMRSAREVAARYGAGVRGWELSLSSREPPAGVQAIEIARADERSFWLPGPSALVVGDVLLGDSHGGIRICPASWVSRQNRYPPEFLDSLRSLLDLTVEMIVVSHGEPVLNGGRPALERAIADVSSVHPP